MKYSAILSAGGYLTGLQSGESMNRIHDLLNAMKASGIDGMLITSVPNITYLTGFTGDASRLIVSKNSCAFLTDGRYTEQATSEIHREIEIFKWINDNRYGSETYQKYIDGFGISTLGFESDVVTHSDFQKFQNELNVDLKPMIGLVENQRMIKDEGEIELLREACSISDKALELTVPFIKPGLTERELAARLEYNMKMEGAEDISFETIILTGKRTSLLHGNPGDTKIQNGDFVQFDFGALYKGYHADMSRTFVVGKASEEQKDFYLMMQKAEIEAIKVLKAGIAGNEPDGVVRNIISDQYIQNYYPGLGHGVGLEIHEQPFMKNTANFTFQSGMVVTVEPGVYIPGWGGMRIEDTVLVNDDGFEILTHFPRDLMEL
jgi:Xaa-Pro aminopeptidase